MSLLIRENWGPALWKIMHILASKSGLLTNKILEDDEAYAWINVFKTLDTIMPCDLCSKHYKEFLKKHNINQLLVLRGYLRSTWLIDFWWNFHNEVNSRTNKSIFLKDDLKIYDDINLFKTNHELIKKMVAKGIEQGNLQMIAAKNALSKIEILRRIYGL